MRNHLNKTPSGGIKEDPNSSTSGLSDTVRGSMQTILNVNPVPNNLITEKNSLREKSSGTHPSIESDFQLGRKYYELSMIPSEMSSQKIEKKDALDIAMTYCQNALDHIGTDKDRLIKTDILLLMVVIARAMGKNLWTQERHFYHAVEIARSYLGKDFLMTNQGKKIKTCFDEYIDPNWSKMFKSSWDNQVLTQLQLHIENESNTRQAYRMKQAKDTKNYITVKDTQKSILDKLQISLSEPFRLIIIEAESGIISMCHNMEMTEAESLRERGHGVSDIDVEVFHKQKKYKILIDRGSRESTSQFSEDQIKYIIKPILSNYIQRLEYVFFSDHADHGLCIRQNEEIEDIDKVQQDYSEFIGRALSDIRHTKGRDDINNTDDYARAIDIARMIILYTRNKNPPISDGLFGQIDRVLGGEINRDVLDMVNSILLSRNETMHGTGYPFGLNQSRISLIGRLFAIIRTYESIQTRHPNNPEIVISTLENWGGGGYLDTRLLPLFVATLSRSDKIPIQKKKNLTDDRINRYNVYLQRWQKLITLLDEMEGLYDAYRHVGVSDSLEKLLAKRIDEKQIEIYVAAELTNIILLGRHEETESDVQEGGAPGSKEEGLNPTGIAKAEARGHILKQLDPEISTGPLPRAKKTAKLMCQTIHNCIGNSAKCPHIKIMDSLTNPSKNKIGGTLSFAAKLIHLEPGRQQALNQLVLDIISSSSQSVHLIITHGDIIRHLLFFIENLFDQDKFIGLRHDVSTATVHTLLFRGDRIVPWDLMFSVSDWVKMLSIINILTESIFGDIFCLKENKKINLIKLKNKLLDYIDLKNETDPDNVQEFIQALDADPLTAHFSAILRIEGVIK